ncbi:hypothetical protein [Natrinema halophilum]|uniref:Uncharacterized protein n=1 Tax=Natrinema halophilum TaxID=1699371 RepID=A0A7D5H0Z6_9EURY|nr:hypothetical protein [Natrinema halophilum]QLG47851.1 hypothetical protein HYG82_02830 [Natrinema halophilum]
MTPNIPYEYTDRDLLEEPESYEYSEVHGRPFLDAYERDRASVLDSIEASVSGRCSSDASHWRGLLEAVGTDPSREIERSLPRLESRTKSDVTEFTAAFGQVPDRDQVDQIETVELEASLLGYPGDRPLNGEIARTWLDCLTKRYEVDKRLSARYDSDMDPIDDEPAPCVAYPLLSLVALVSHERTGNLKYLNVALKLGDLLSSRHESIDDQGTLAVTYLALAVERDAMQALATSVGVEQ